MYIALRICVELEEISPTCFEFKGESAFSADFTCLVVTMKNTNANFSTSLECRWKWQNNHASENGMWNICIKF